MKNLSCLFALVSALSLLVAHADDDDLLADLSDDTSAETSSDSSDESGSDEGSDEGGGESVSDDGDSSDEEEVDVGVPGISNLKKKEKPRIYHTLPVCLELDGKAEVLRPGATEWQDIEEGRHYALGTLYRTVPTVTEPKPKLRVQFGPEVEVSMRGEASFGTRAQPLGGTSRTIMLGSGTITVKLPSNLATNSFVVTAPGFTSVNQLGKAKYTYRKTGDGDEAKIRCVTGRVCLEGRHFSVPEMKAANEVRIRTSQDLLFTALYGSRGDYVVRLDQGRIVKKDFETGKDVQEEKTLDWRLSPETAVRIHRAMPALGERMAVTTMTFDATGELKNRCAFTEHMIEVNSGELGPTSKKDREAIAKRAEEASALSGELATTEEAAAESADASADAEESSDSGSGDDDLDF